MTTPHDTGPVPGSVTPVRAGHVTLGDAAVAEASPGGFGNNQLIRAHVLGHAFAHLLHTLGDSTVWTPQTWQSAASVMDQLHHDATDVLADLDGRLDAALHAAGLRPRQGGRS